MIPLDKIKPNVKNPFLTTPRFLQLLFSLKVLWMGIAGLFGIRYIISHLNYLVEYPNNVLLLIVGIIGLIGSILKNYSLSVLFGVCNLFIFSLSFLTFVVHPPEYMSISSGIYLIDLLGAIWLLYRMGKNHDLQNL